MNRKDQLDIMKAVPMKGTCKMCVCSEANLVVSLLIVESSDGTTVARHSRNCQTAAFELSESVELCRICLLYTSPSPRDGLLSRMPSSA